MIGRFPSIAADAARHTALSLTLEMGRGAGKVYQAGAPNLETAMETYLARPKLRSEVYKHATRQQLTRHLKDWMKLQLDEITKAMVVRKHQDMSNIPSAANHTLRQFRSIWNHARRVHDLPESPTVAIEWFDEQPEGTIISDLRTWKLSVDEMANPIHKVFYELLLFTGFRKTEAATLKWKHIHEDHIHLPQTKNGRSFDLPI